VHEQSFRARLVQSLSLSKDRGALLLCPVGILILVVKILEPMAYPAGDVRNSMVFRLSLYGALTLVLIAVMVLAARWLLADRRHSRRGE
jgi:hypothetical protein